MENIATEGNVALAIEAFDDQVYDRDIVEFEDDFRHRDSLSENFVNEIEAWARHSPRTASATSSSGSM